MYIYKYIYMYMWAHLSKLTPGVCIYFRTHTYIYIYIVGLFKIARICIYTQIQTLRTKLGPE